MGVAFTRVKAAGILGEIEFRVKMSKTLETFFKIKATKLLKTSKLKNGPAKRTRLAFDV
jgi:hypothetical protein